jgi:hypothetical protein
VLDSAGQLPQLATRAREIYAAAAMDGQAGADVSSLIDRMGRCKP